MDSCKNNEHNEVDKEFIFFSILKDGTFVPRFRHLLGEKIPPVDDTVTATGVKIKDVDISPDVSARVFLPGGACTSNKLPLLLYIHGGGFCMESAFSRVYTRYVSHLVAEANVIAVSVEYGLYPKRPIPACYEDSWAALQWVASHGKGHGPDPWINDYADLQRVFVGGDSAGGNISHTLLARVGSIGLPEDVRVEGMILAHPFFGIDGKDDEMWLYMCPTNEGPSDRRMKPNVEDLGRIGCGRVLVVVAEMDHLIGAGKGYVDDLIKSGWNGTVEIVENKGKKHCFHVHDLEDEDAVANVQRIKSFIHLH